MIDVRPLAAKRLQSAIAVLLLVPGAAWGASSSEAPPSDALVLSLDGAWRMEGVLPGEGVKKLFHQVEPDCSPAFVPGDVYTDLWRVGRIDDPHVGMNGQRAKWVMDYEWWYFKPFKAPAAMKDKQVRLRFDGVDYECEVWLNGERLGDHEGAFSRFEFDVTGKLNFNTARDRSDNNLLAVRLAPPPRSFALVNGRKYRWHGDYGNNVTPFGLWRPVRLEATGPVRVTDVYVKSDLQSDGAADLDVQVTLDNDSYQSRELSLDVVIRGGNFESAPQAFPLSYRAEPGQSVCRVPITLEDARLWYPWDLGEQNLYRVEVTVREGAELQDEHATSFAVRELKMEMNPGWTKDEVEYPWTAMINGKRHYMRAACWGGPPDMFTGRVTEGQYREYIRLAKEANINHLRIFCWHPPESDLFYRLCDEAGITVWQDFTLSHPFYPQNGETKRAIFAESVDVVKQLRNHPSVIVYSGGEEILYVQSDDDSDWALQLITELEEAIAPHHDVHWVPTCPLSWPNVQGVFKPRESIHAHAPHYGAGMVMMEDYYPGLEYAYIPELAITSCPSPESIRKFIPADEVWPPGPSWGYHWADLDVLRIHNHEVFGDQRVGSLEEFTEATQIAQGVYFQFSGEHFRRMKPKNSGVAFCHFMLHTPDMKWAIVDFYLEKKKSFDYVRRAFQPVLVSLEHEKRRWNAGSTFEGSVWVVNDLYEDYPDCRVEVEFLDKDRQVTHRETLDLGEVAADSSAEFGKLNVPVPGEEGDEFHVTLRLLDRDGSSLSENEYLMLVGDHEEARAYLKRMGDEAKARKRNGGATLRYFKELQGDRYVPTELIEDFRANLRGSSS